MKFLLKFCFVNLIVLLLNFNYVSAQTEDTINAGKAIFDARCVACHAGGKNAIMPDRTLQIETLKQYEMDDIEKIKTQVTNGKNAMPAFNGALDEDDINNVANYVLNQAKNGW